MYFIVKKIMYFIVKKIMYFIVLWFPLFEHLHLDQYQVEFMI